MRMQTCPNCGGNEFTELPDGWVCQYCDTWHAKPPQVVTAVRQTKPAFTEETRPLNQVLLERNKWLSFLLCFFFGMFGVHKFYEKKIGMGILYLFTYGLFGIGWIVDCIILLMKPNPYYV